MQCKNYDGVACVNGSCQIALAEEYEECCMPIIKDCENCALSGTEYCVK